MNKINYVKIDSQTKFLMIFGECKMFQAVQMKEENAIIYSNNSLHCSYLKYHPPLRRILTLFNFSVLNIWISDEIHFYHLLRIMSVKYIQ